MLFALFTGIYFTMIGTMIRRGLNRDSIISFEVFSSRVKPETKKIFEFQILLHRKVNLQSLFAPMGNSTNPPLPSHTRTRTKKKRRDFVFKSPMEKERCRSAIRTTKRKTMIYGRTSTFPIEIRRHTQKVSLTNEKMIRLSRNLWRFHLQISRQFVNLAHI